jgi:hypothetical protein
VREDTTNPLLDVLRLSGIVRTTVRVSTGRSAAPCLSVRNRIYAHVFDRSWVLQHMPDAELRRQRLAFRRGLIRAGATASVLIAVLTGLTGFAWSQRNQAQEASRQSERLAASLRVALDREATAREEMAKALKRAQRERSRANGEADRASREAFAAQRARERADEAKRKADDSAAQASRQEHVARQAAANERSERLRNARLLYDADMELAAQAWEQGATRRVRDLLEAHEPKPGEEDLRGFDWRYQWRLLNRNALVLRGHAGGVSLGAVTPDGRLVTVDGDHQLRHWDLTSGRVVRRLSLATECPLYHMALSHDGRFLAARTSSGDIRLLDTITGRVRRVLKGHGPGAIRRSLVSQFPRDPLALAFSPDDTRVVSLGTFDRTVRVWDLTTGREVRRIEGMDLNTTHSLIAADLALSPDGRTLALAGYALEDYQATLLDLNARTARESWIRAIPCEGGTQHSVLFSPDGSALASGAFRGDVTLADPSTGKSLHKIAAH